MNNLTLNNAARVNEPTLDLRRVQFPYTVKVGNVAFRIHPYTKKKGETSYMCYRFRWRDAQNRRRTMDSSDLNALVVAARAKATAINSGNADALVLTSADKLAYERSVSLLKPTGVLLETAVSEYVQARRLLDGGSVLEAARFFVKQHPKNLVALTLPQLVEKCLEAKVKNGRSRNTIHGPTSRLSRYAETHPGLAQDELQQDRIQAFLDGVKPVNAHKGRTEYSPRTINNFIHDIANLVHFGGAKNYLPPGFNPMSGVDKRTEPGKEEEVYTPVEMKTLLNEAGLPMRLFMTVCGFGGLRHSEAMRLEMADVSLEEGIIKVRAAKTKKKVRRVVRMNKPLKSWLKVLLPQRRMSKSRPGFLVPVNNMSKPQARLSAKTGIEWKTNALRNTYISSRAVLEKNLAVIAFDCGTSPGTIRSNYLHLLPVKDARAWWRIVPPAHGCVVDLAEEAEALRKHDSLKM
ncbi:MAG: tyrosine-type recombinase/integrase [Limisphaerales bacterium]